MARIRRTKDGEKVYNMDLTQDEVNAISYALDIALEYDDTYDVDTHDYLQELFAEMWEGDFEEGPEQFSGYSTSISLIEEDTQGVVLDLNERIRKNKEAHWEKE